MDERQRFDWLRLIRTDGVGPRTFRSLINHFGGARAALEGLPDLARQRGAKAVRIPSVQAIERELEAAWRLGVRFVAMAEPDYPRPLAAIDTAPPILALRGSAATLKAPAVAIVGSRNASAAGRTLAERIAQGLGQAGFTVASGLARGIDAAAHAAALPTGTVAVLAGGHDKVYPPENAGLLEAIAERGAVLSEMPMGWEPRGRDFPRRNRIVSGLALGLVLVEAAQRSGSLITARFALEQGREVCAVPGSPLDPRADGTNDLIRQGATLVRNAADVVAVLSPLVGLPPADDRTMREQDGNAEEPLWDEWDPFGAEASGPAIPGTPTRDLRDRPDACGSPSGSDQPDFMTLIGGSPVSVDDLVRLSRLPAREVQARLLDLDLAGRIERPAPHLVTLKSPSA
ncbi:MAG: DNA-processing protein DprA [Alsobacter sp.]